MGGRGSLGRGVKEEAGIGAGDGHQGAATRRGEGLCDINEGDLVLGEERLEGDSGIEALSEKVVAEMRGHGVAPGGVRKSRALPYNPWEGARAPGREREGGRVFDRQRRVRRCGAGVCRFFFVLVPKRRAWNKRGAL